MRTRDELRTFVASLAISPERREVVQFELEDHVFERMAELEAAGVLTPEAERRAVESLGAENDLGMRLVRAEAAFTLSKRQCLSLGTRTGSIIAVAAVGAAFIDPSMEYAEPTPFFFAFVLVVVFAAFPFRVLRPFLAAQRMAIDASRRDDQASVKRLQDPASTFLGGLVTSAIGPFLLWIVFVGLQVPLGPFEGPMLRSIFAAFLVNLLTAPIASIALLQVTPRRRIPT